MMVPGIRVVMAEDLEFLGAPLMDEGIKAFIDTKISQAKLLTNRSGALSSHQALFSLRNFPTSAEVVVCS